MRLFTEAMLDGQFWGPTETRTCSFVFIGKDLDKDVLLGGFEASRARWVDGEQGDGPLSTVACNTVCSKHLFTLYLYVEKLG